MASGLAGLESSHEIGLDKPKKTSAAGQQYSGSGQNYSPLRILASRGGGGDPSLRWSACSQLLLHQEWLLIEDLTATI